MQANDEAAKAFWGWFEQNAPALTGQSGPEGPSDEKITAWLEEATVVLHGYHPDIDLELATLEDDTMLMVVTAHGEEKHFEAVDRLVAAAPAAKGWEFEALAPALEDETTLTIEDLELDADEIGAVFARAATEGERRLDLELYLPNFGEVSTHEYLETGLHELITQLIGERAMAEHIGAVELLPLELDENGEPEGPPDEMISLSDLPQVLEAFQSGALDEDDEDDQDADGSSGGPNRPAGVPLSDN